MIRPDAYRFQGRPGVAGDVVYPPALFTGEGVRQLEGQRLSTDDVVAFTLERG